MKRGREKKIELYIFGVCVTIEIYIVVLSRVFFCVILWYYCGVHWNVKISMSNISTDYTLRNEHFSKRWRCLIMHMFIIMLHTYGAMKWFLHWFGKFKWKRRFDFVAIAYFAYLCVIVDWFEELGINKNTMKLECSEPRDKNSLIYTISL